VGREAFDKGRLVPKNLAKPAEKTGATEVCEASILQANSSSAKDNNYRALQQAPPGLPSFLS
jgi:hypothetical protein